MTEPVSGTRDAAEVDEFRLLRPLVAGGRDGVWLAHDRRLDRPVVLQFLTTDGSRKGSVDGVRALAKVSHPYLCRVHRVRETGDWPYVVSELARGQRLDAQTPPLADRRVVEIGCALASALAAIHSAGVAHGDVRAARVMLDIGGAARLFGARRARADADDAAKAKDVAGLLELLAAVAAEPLRSRLVALRRATHARSAEDLRGELEALASPAARAALVPENPYRGLRCYDAEHGALYFGRQAEVDVAIERLRSEPWCLVAARSGAGKSSFVRAGIAAAVARGALGGRPRWDVAVVAPGARPLDALADRLAVVLGRDGAELRAALRRDPRLAGRLARGRRGAGLLVVIDPLEEALTLSTPEERALFVEAIAGFAELAPGTRVVLSVRSDFLARLGEEGATGRALLRAAFMLPPMGPEALRAAIASPARVAGFDFESAAMVDALAAEAMHQGEALPLLSFALAELWGERDPARGVIPAAALARLGGTAAALARHGDVVLASLRPEERREARRILLALVTSADVRVARTEGELLGTEAPDAARAALGALVRGRLVVAGEASFEIAHESLARAWPRLREWVEEAEGARAAAARLEAGARDWDRAGRAKDALWTARQIEDLDAAGPVEPASELASAFLVASRVAVGRARSRRRAGIVAAVAIAAALAGGAPLALAAQRRASVERVLAEARAIDATATDAARAADDLRARAFARFEASELTAGEALWKEMLAQEAEADRVRREAGIVLDRALAIDPRHAGARAVYADVTLARLLAAERLHQAPLASALRGRLGLYDDGSRAAWLRAPARVRVETDPPGAALTLSRYRPDAQGHLVESDAAPIADGETRALEPGSYLLVASLADRYPTRAPFVVKRGEERVVRLALPRAADVPAGAVYVPAGRFVYGSDDDEATRAYLSHQPAQEVELPAYLVTRTEVTYAAYLAYLRALPADARAARVPDGLHLSASASGVATLDLGVSKLTEAEPYCHEGRPCVDWHLLPVDGASREDAEAYGAWLSATGSLPGARVCTDREWERAARGADDRRLPNGDAEPAADEACVLTTNGGDVNGGAACAVGSHPATRSPFGVDDMTGNVFEWTAGVIDAAHPELAGMRGGSWDGTGVYLWLPGRGLVSPASKTRTYGFRLCAPAN